MQDVTIVRWPDERSLREDLAKSGRARLLLVEADAAPPIASDPLEDWVRTPCGELDVRARMEGLRLRLAKTLELVPELDADGVIRYGDRWAPLPPVEARLTSELVRRFGAVVSRDDLAAAGWPGAAPGRNALDVHMLRLRRRLEPVRLAIRTVRSRGYLLEPAAASTAL
ncbi:MAG: winged helix-turn-helix domain-containing protein [Acidimicrobiia bacterium]|jgi:DNA-binding response OmpR family regulator